MDTYETFLVVIDRDAYPEDELLSPAQALKVAHISRSTLLRAEQSGLISPYRTPGGHRRYRRGDLDALLTLKTAS